MPPATITTILGIVLACIIYALVHFTLTNIRISNDRIGINPSIALAISLGCALGVLLWRAIFP